MKKQLHNTLAIFILFLSSLLGLSNSNAQTGTLAANPETVAVFDNANGTGNTALTWTSDGAAKVIITHTSTNGGTSTAESVVIGNPPLQKTDHAINYIQDGRVHTFRLYFTDVGSTVFLTEKLLATVVVTGEAVATGTISASPEVVTAFTNANGTGNSTISWSTVNSPRTLVTLRRTLEDGTEISPETLVIQNNNPSSSVNANYISEGHIHTFKLHTGEAGSSVLGDLLNTVIVYGGDVSLSVNEIESQDTEAVSVFPNPVENVLNVKTSKDILAIEIYNIIGQKLKKVTVDGSNKATIDVSALQQNLYVLQITTLDGVLSKRFAKK
jgi:hypothetical protein